MESGFSLWSKFQTRLPFWFISGLCLLMKQITSLNPVLICACPKPGPRFPISYVVDFFCVQWTEVRGDSLFCWYWWNCWPSLFKLSFHKLQWLLALQLYGDSCVVGFIPFLHLQYFEYIFAMLIFFLLWCMSERGGVELWCLMPPSIVFQLYEWR